MTALFFKVLPFLVVFLSAFLLTLVLTPLVREVNRRLGMVDKPDPRRINKVPIPRAGGVALFVGLFGSFLLYASFADLRSFGTGVGLHPTRMAILAGSIFVLGLLDDKFSLPPKVKLLGQIAVAFATWLWGDLGFHTLWPEMPKVVDCVITVFWIIGAVNAFNLIDGLDGLASGIALIAVLGMAISLIFVGMPQETLFHFAFAGALVGFLRYNYNPASIFLGDSGSMLIGYLVSTLPLATQAPNSFLVSVGVPVLAMGVPIFDTFLAILRRSIRHLILKRENRQAADGDSGQVMTADHDHLHHRILRATGLNQRKTAWILYLMALAAVLFGISGIVFKSRSAGLWIVAFGAAIVIIFRDMARVELFDAGRLLASVAHDKAASVRRRWAKLAIPLYVTLDIAAITAAFFVMCYVMQIPVSRASLRVALPIRLVASFASLVLFRTYVTVWSRAMTSNFVRLGAACALGSVLGTVGIYYAPTIMPDDVATSTVVGYTLVCFFVTFLLVAMTRLARPVIRDAFYSIDCSRLKGRKDISRVLVYGAGLRYRSFRRELVRKASANDRIVVGLLDNDILLRGQYIGGIKVYGTLLEAPEIINELNVDAVVVACEVSDQWIKIIKETLAPTGVKVTHFNFTEKEII